MKERHFINFVNHVNPVLLNSCHPVGLPKAYSALRVRM